MLLLREHQLNLQANLIFRRLVWPLDIVVERGLQIDRLLAEFHNLPEAVFTTQVIHANPLDYSYSSEQHRFGRARRLWWC